MHHKGNINMWLVVHTPKTAGTSLRSALDKYLGSSNIVRDYGPKADATSDVVREHLYSQDKSKGPGTLVAEISKQGNSVLMGHFFLPKYADYFEARNIIAFVRDPLVRVCSEYLHRTNNGSFVGTFSEYVKKPGNRSLQSRFLEGISGESFIGLTEQYRESLQHINRITGWKLSTLKKNVARRGGGRKLARKLSVRDLDLFYKMNIADMELYKVATVRFTALGISRSNNAGFLNWKKRNHQAS